MELSIGIAFIAGLISFVSPCVLPLVPAYVGYMGGRVTTTVSAQVGAMAGGGTQQINVGTPLSTRFNTFLHGLFFVSGFTFVFVAIGLLSTAFITEIGGGNISLITDVIGRVGGVIIVIFGFHFMGLLPSFFLRLRKNQETLDNPLISVVFLLAVAAIALWSLILVEPAIVLIAIVTLWMLLGGAFTKPADFWNKIIGSIERLLYSDTRKQMTASGHQGYGGSAVMGVVFSAGWTPCIGPVYGAILTMAANGGDIGQAGSLLTAYSLGLGIPFLTTALLLDSAQNALRRLQRHMRKIELTSGAFLILIGVLVGSGQLQQLSTLGASGNGAEISIGIEERVLNFFGIETGLEGAETASTDPDIFISGEAGNEASNAVAAPDELAGDQESAVGSLSDAADVAPPAVGLSVGNLAPDFQTVLDTGEPIALSELRGNVVLLNFWATWCGPCRIEMPEFQAIFDEQREHGFTVLAVDNQESVEDVQGFREELELTFPLAMDERGDIQDEYGIFSYPSTYILDENGVIIAKNFGAMTVGQIRQLVSGALDTTA